MSWISKLHLPQSHAPGLSYLSSRTSSGWRTENVVPPQSAPTAGGLEPSEVNCPIENTFVAWSQDLTKGVLRQQAGPTRGFFQEFNCGHDEPRLVTGEPEAFKNLFVRDFDANTWQLVNVTPSTTFFPLSPEENLQKFFPAAYLAGSEDLRTVVFEEEAELTRPAEENLASYPRNVELYEWRAGAGASDGDLRLVSVLPDGRPVHGMLAGATRQEFSLLGPDTPTGVPTRQSEKVEIVALPRHIAEFRHAVSADGARVFFETFGTEAALYMREDGTRSVQLDAPSPGAGGPGGGGEFEIASADGALAYFTADASRGVTPDTRLGSGQNLYRFDVESETLTNVTPAAEANVLGVMGASEDGSIVYFVAEGALAEGAQVGEPNLYLYRLGAGVTYIATLDPADRCDWETPSARIAGEHGLCGEKSPIWTGVKGVVGGAGLTSRTAPSGRFLAFNSIRSLTGYDNTNAKTGEPEIEIFIYDAQRDALLCASCNYGQAPVGPSAIHFASPATGGNEFGLNYPQRQLTDNGRLFFESPDHLVRGDRNGPKAADVYEWELPGTGTCTTQSPAYSAEHGGCLYLLSSGHDSEISKFLDATPDGRSVFIETAEKLLPSDGDSAYDIYVVRTGGGFVEPRDAPQCAGDECRATLVGPPTDRVPGTATFNGPGNRAEHRHRERKAKHRHGKAHRRKATRRRGNARRRKRHARLHRLARSSAFKRETPRGER